MEDQYFLSYPGGDFNYSDGRFTNSSDTDPSSDTYAGTWHEQLGLTFLGLVGRHQQPRWRDRLCLRRRDDRERDERSDRHLKSVSVRRRRLHPHRG